MNDLTILADPAAVILDRLPSVVLPSGRPAQLIGRAPGIVELAYLDAADRVELRSDVLVRWLLHGQAKGRK